jgi:phage-related protein
MKAIIWLGDSLDETRRFPAEARREAGYQLDRVQHGLAPSDFKPMPTVGAGVHEIRVHAESEYRVIYVAKFADAIYVLHAFVKKSPRTSKRDIELAASRFRAIAHGGSND